MGIGERIKELRGPMSREDFAALFGLHRNTIMRYESGERSMDAAFLQSICEKYSISADWLLLGRGPMHPDDQGRPPTEERRIIEHGRRRTDLPMSSQLRRAVEGLLYLEGNDLDGFDIIKGDILRREEKAREFEDLKKISGEDA